MRTGRVVAVIACLGAISISGAHAAADNKKSAPAPAGHPAAPAAHPAGPAGGGAHGPAGGGGAPASHGPTTGGAGASHGVTTGGASHGVTTSGAAHGVTTSSASHGITTSGATRGVTTGGGGEHGATTTGGAHPATTGTGAGHAGTTPNGAGANRTTTSGGVKPGAGVTKPPGASNAHLAAHPAPKGSHDVQAKNGAAVRTRADGSRSDVHDPKRNMDIHHGLSGNRRTTVERADHSRVVAERGGRGYVQHPYSFHGREFGHRTYYANGRAYDRFYGRYAYGGGVYLDVYAPAAFYPVGFYGYAYAPWAAPVPYAWGWGAAPWYGYYGAFYAPYPVYPAPAFWLADFVIAASLQAAFVAQAAEAAQLGPVPSGPPALLEASRWVADLLVEPAEADAKPAMTAEVKQMVADEIKAIVQHEGDESKSNAANQDVDPAKNSVATLLSDNQPHVFVAGTDVDLVTAGSSQECAISQGDVLKVTSLPQSAATANAIVLASKLGTKKYDKECAPSATVTVTVSDLQDMRNHMREQVDDGLSELQSKQGKGGLPAAPAGAAGAPTPAAFAAAAPPPDATAADEIKKQASQADQAENEAVASTSADAAASDSGSSTTRIAVGQSIDTVTRAMGNPTRIIDAGAKKIYAYPDMKITFTNGKVSDVE